MVKKAFILALFILAPLAAWAQQEQLDPRLTNQTIVALQSLLALREAQLKVVTEDFEKKIADLKQRCGDPCK